MASYNDYVSSLTPAKTSVNPYAGLFAGSSGTPYKSLSGLFGSTKPTPAPLPTPAKPTPLVSSSPSSTSTTPTVVKPPVASTPASSSKSAYVSSLTTPPSSPVSSTPPPAAATPVSTPTSTPSNDPNADSLKAYLATLTNPDLTKARTDLADVQTRNEQAQVDARRQYQDALDASGGLKGGALSTAGVLDRRNNANLADIALQESAATRTLSSLTDATKPIQIGDTYIDPVSGKIIYTKPVDNSYTLGENQARYDTTGKLISSGPTSGITLGKDQSRYELDPTTGKYKLVASGPSSNSDTGAGGAYVAGTNPVVDAWVQNINSGKAKLSDLTGNPTLKNQVSQGLAGSKDTGYNIASITQSSLVDLQKMVDNNEGFTGAVGFKGPIGTIFGIPNGTSGANFAAKAKQVVNDIVLPNLTILHGLGRVTDREFQALTNSLTALGIDPKTGTSSISESQFKTELANVIKQFNDAHDITSNKEAVTLTKNGQSFDASALSPDELKQAIADGYVQQ